MKHDIISVILQKKTKKKYFLFFLKIKISLNCHFGLPLCPNLMKMKWGVHLNVLFEMTPSGPKTVLA